MPPPRAPARRRFRSRAPPESEAARSPPPSPRRRRFRPTSPPRAARSDRGGERGRSRGGGDPASRSRNRSRPKEAEEVFQVAQGKPDDVRVRALDGLDVERAVPLHGV